MTSRAKRLTFILVVAALVAFVAGAVMAPDTVAAPNSKFTITTEEVEGEDGTSGTFVATGAITGAGTACQTFGIGFVLVGLRSEAGWINLEVIAGKGRWAEPKAFEVTYANGDYAHLLGATGSYSYVVTYPDGPDGPFAISRTFKGSVPN